MKVGFKKMIWLVVGALFGIAWFFASSRAYASHGKLPGIYIRAHTWYGEGYPIQELHARGEMLSLNWSDLEVGDTEAHRGYYFDNNRLRGWLEKEIAAGKAPALTLSVYNGRLAGGIAVPEYVKHIPNAVVTTTVNGHPWLLPKYWDDAFLSRYTRFIRDMGTYLKTHPKDKDYKFIDKIAFVSIGTGTYGEINAAGPDVQALVSAGMTPNAWYNAVERITDAYIEAFSEPVDPNDPSKGRRLLVSLQQQTAPYTFGPKDRYVIATYSAAHGVGLSIDGLYAEQKQAIFGNRPNLEYSGMYDQIFLYNGIVPIAWESYNYMLCNPTQVYWGMLNGLDKHPDYMRLTDDLFYEKDSQGNIIGKKTENIEIFEWASKYLGVTITNTPSVWVAMRDSRAPWQTCWQANPPWQPGQQPHGEIVPDTYPQWGNYSFWLEQDDSVPGGFTYPETNMERSMGGYPMEHIGVNTSPYNPNLPPGKEGWVIRRTDQASGNNYMFFRVSDGYVFKGSGPVTITVTYWDNYTDTWALAYDAAGGVQRWAVPDGSDKPYVQKEGTNTYRKAVFHIPDARFGNGLTGNTDFFIYNREDGDEWIHFVDVQADRNHREPEPTPTPTPTVTPTPTPTPTPIPYGNAAGNVFVDEDRDFLPDPHEAGVSGATVQILQSGSVLTSTLTNVRGEYRVDDLSPGLYVLRVLFPKTYKAEAFDSLDISVSAGTTTTVDIPALREYFMYLPVLRK